MSTFVEVAEPILTVAFFQNGGAPYVVPVDQYLYVEHLYNAGSLLVDGVSFSGLGVTSILYEAWFGPGATLSSPGAGANTVYIIGTLYKFGPI